ncbi:DUF2752 domain-containing protein [Maribacter confluentis]|uniref:DUF2752 domain-containing protein n=2 Tax=Maribacter TaxID=252356 RepID=A0ABY1SL09_9FLAO|nr:MULTISPECIES: DUF2752 domain-containing protein [Maribacter]MDO1514187.1 DUF2752 domain-containing protein [Maribacter confluentis]SNR68723.1 Protein of unknown function [Maribacter sedimenticola]
MRLRALFIYLGLDNFMLPCFTKKLIGIDCPGCGMQRAILFLTKGEFIEAFKMYPAIYPMLLLLAFLGANKLYTIKYANTITIILMISTVGFILTNYILKFI